MGRPFKVYLSGPRIYSCSTCRAHAADHDDIISKVRAGPPSLSQHLHRWMDMLLRDIAQPALLCSAGRSRRCFAACSNSKDVTGGHTLSTMCTRPNPAAMLTTQTMYQQLAAACFRCRDCIWSM